MKLDPGVRVASAFRCGTCHLITRVKVPKGDATRIVATAHYVAGERCPGSGEDAFEVEK